MELKIPCFWPFYHMKATCPYCFKRFHLSDAPLRARPTGLDEFEGDSKVQKFLELNEPARMRRLREPPERTLLPKLWSRVALDNGFTRDHYKACPSCHLTLPEAIGTGQVRGTVVAVIGEKGAGKSTYFGALVQQLIEGSLAGRAGFALVAQDSFDVDHFEQVSSEELWRKRYGRSLFGADRRALEGTKSIRTNKALRTPLIYRLLFTHRPLWHYLLRPRASYRVTDLILYDTAGEDLESDEIISRYYQFLPRVQGVVFLIDPLRLTGVRQRLSPGALRGQADGASEASSIVRRFLNQYDRLAGVRVDQAVKVPAAVVVSKSDELREVVGPGSPLLFPSNHVHGLDLDDARRTSQLVHDHLINWGEGNMVNALKRFSNVGYFAVSSLGRRPGEDGRIDGFNPMRVADPLFWILYHLGFLPPVFPQRPATTGAGA